MNNKGINYNKCKRILQLDFDSITDIEKLQKYRVNLIDSFNFINKYKEYGLLKDSIERGFIVQVPELSIDSFVPKDKFMSLNIKYALEKIDNILEQLYKEIDEEDISLEEQEV